MSMRAFSGLLRPQDRAHSLFCPIRTSSGKRPSSQAALPFMVMDRVDPWLDRRRFRTVAMALLCLCILSCLACALRGTRLLAEKIDRFVLTAVDSRYAASVLVAVDGKVILQKGYGWTDAARSSPATPETLFNVASVTKSFTAVSVFQLKDSGRLRLEDTLPVFFEDVPMDKQSVTVRQLLLHTWASPRTMWPTESENGIRP